MSTEAENPPSADKLAQALSELLSNPMPHDLVAIRREVETEYDGDEEAAKEKMEAWCSQEYLEKRIRAHREAWHNAAEVLRGYDGAGETSTETNAPCPANALDMREKALRDIKAVHTRWYHRGEITSEEAVQEMEAITVSVWQLEESPNAERSGGGKEAL